MQCGYRADWNLRRVDLGTRKADPACGRDLDPHYRCPICVLAFHEVRPPRLAASFGLSDLGASNSILVCLTSRTVYKLCGLSENRNLPEYCAYILGEDGNFAGSIKLDCPDDEAAKEVAKQLVDGHDVELWRRTRKVETFKHNPK